LDRKASKDQKQIHETTVGVDRLFLCKTETKRKRSRSSLC